MKVATAQGRIRSSKGSSFLTHGGDNYDHRSLNVARRALDKALIEEELNEEPCAFVTPKSGTNFRLVLWTQIRENYGSHSWDGKGECPQYWKCKGGEEYHVQIGTVNKCIELGSKGIQEIVDKATPMITKSDDYWRENVIGWALFSDAEETSGEADERQSREWGMPCKFVTALAIQV